MKFSTVLHGLSLVAANEVSERCRDLITSNVTAWADDCKGKCDYYGPEGAYKDYCPNVGTDAEALVKCIIGQATYCQAAERTCEEILTSPLPDWAEDCREKCALYGPGGQYNKAYCPGVNTNGMDLAKCVHENNAYCIVGSLSTTSPVSTACKKKITSKTPDHAEYCRRKCDFYGPRGTYEAHCPNVGNDADALVKCIIAEATYCQIA